MEPKLIRFLLEQADTQPVSKRIEIYTALLRSFSERDRDQSREITLLIEELQKVEQHSQQLLLTLPR